MEARGVVVQVSLEGVRAESHERVRGEGSFERTLAGIRLLVAGGLAPRICVTFTEMAHNFDELPDLLAMVDGWGVGRFVSGTLVQGGRAAGQSALAPPTPQQYGNLLARYRDDAAFRDRYRRIGNVAALEWARGGGDAAPGCCRLVETPYVTAGGRIHPCVMLHAGEFAAEGAYDRPLAEVIGENIDSWGRLEALRGLRRERVAACRDCPHADRCGAGCMGRAFAAFGDAFAVEDRCRLRQAVYRQAPLRR
jgi:radical SAM protein with 4Fe4S-binding SPASM domain